MHLELTHLHPVTLPRPARGESVRMRLGRFELILERQRGGVSLLCLDGEDVRTWSLGLGDDGEIVLHCRAPRFPLALVLRDTVAVMPGGRVRGFVQVPLVPTLLWRRREPPDEVVVELLPPMLAAEWDDGQQTCVQRCVSSFAQRIPPPSGNVCVVLPLTVVNRDTHLQSPETMPLALADHELRSIRGHVVAAPRRLVLHGSGGITTTVRANWGAKACAP